ncbi:hypothetical protein [Paenarthrobacter nitroguajacolicus]|nr:hypothetical protein [Paenarthrobacter nitroguajacolicus]
MRTSGRTVFTTRSACDLIASARTLQMSEDESAYSYDLARAA